MKRPRQSPEAVPFRRGPRPPVVRIRSAPMEWISSSIFEALEADGTHAHRLATGKEAWLERFGPDLLLSYQEEAAREAFLGEAAVRCDIYGFKPQRIFGKHLPRHAAERGAPALLKGDATLPLETEVTEAGIKYGLDFATGYSAGLFIDQRANRARVGGARPRRMLNTFAYTCSFSVVAARAGAETVSVDLSRRSLTRGEDNFRRNGIDPKQGHRFLADDALAVLPRLARRGETFDFIILDPPTFSRNQAGSPFQVQRDFEKLIGLALEVAARGAQILLSVNHSEMRVADLERMGRGALRLAGRSGRTSPAASLADFPTGHGAKTVWLEVG